jgi:hypothetical protein
MDEKQDTAETAELADGAPRRRRVPPPTIDLQATESPETAAGPEQPQDATSEPPPAGSGNASRPFVPLLAAGALGAAIALIVAAAAWMWLGPAGERGADGDARLTRIEAQLDALARRAAAPGAPVAQTPQAPQTPIADAKALGALTDRLARIETKLAEQAGAVEREVKPLTDKVADLGQRNDAIMASAQIARERADAAAKSLADVAQQLTQLNAERARTPQVQRSDLDALAARLAGVESATKAIGEQITRSAEAGGGDTRQAVVAFALKSAVDRGVPYAGELDAVRPFADAATLAALEPFAKGGVPSAAALAHEASALVPALVSAADTAQPPGALARLWGNAKRMIRLRPVGNVPGNGADAVIARLELKAAQSDLDGVIAEAGNLPAAARGAIEPWIKRVQARKTALAAAEGLATGTLTRLGRDTPQNQGAPQR